MTLLIKGASKENAKQMKRPGRSPQGKDFFDADSIERTLNKIYSVIESKKEKQAA